MEQVQTERDQNKHKKDGQREMVLAKVVIAEVVKDKAVVVVV
jgi:hypothetical protein